MNNKNLSEIIKKYKLSIKDNPYGILRYWPYSYVELFYEKFCNEIYKNKKSPRILEIDQKNILNLNLWEYFFDNPKIENLTLEKIEKENNKNYFDYDMIIINNFDSKNLEIIKRLITLLNRNGVFVIENVGRNLIPIIKIYFFFFNCYNFEIKDYRLDKFILHNCLLVISKKKKSIFKFNFLKNLFYLFLFIIFESLISFLILIFKK